jgi:4-alpha-glucanotransferase
MRNNNIPAGVMTGRRAGVGLHLTSLPGKYGIGEIGAAAHRFIDLMCDMQLEVWQFLPIGPTAFGNSPYQPLSTFAGNELLIDVSALISDGLLRRNDAAALEGLPAAAVDFPQLVQIKNSLLAMAADRFCRKPAAELAESFELFLQQNDDQWLHDYALFRVLKSEHGEAAWTEWAPEYRDRKPAALHAAETRFATQIRNRKVLQFLFDRQWAQLRAHARERGITLFGDLPIYIAPDSADAWAGREMLNLDASGRPDFVAGVPADYFSDDGQLWGNPLYDWDWHAATGYRWWIARLRRCLLQADLVRIDHFRAFASYWAVAATARTAQYGEWRTGPGDALIAAIIAAFGDVPLVAEDLGDINEDVESLRDRHAIPGMKVLQFELARDDFAPDDIPERCVCYTGTHDNDTTLGWFRSLSASKGNNSMRKRILAACDGMPRTVHRDVTRLAFSSDARLAIAPLQDYLGLGSGSRMNIPGTARDNWRWRVRQRQLGSQLTDYVAALVCKSCRRG